MNEHIEAFKKSVAALALKFEETHPQLWALEHGDIDRMHKLVDIGVDALTALDALAVARFYERVGLPEFAAFRDVFNELTAESGYCMEVVQAGVIWNLFMVRIADHIRDHKKLPVDFAQMAADFIDNGDLDPHREY